ncbi:hypothetical protein [Ohtaekwangia sp.]|uniref:hypothetical protein n=1 Tax=Ohtaekwangia sp. TaxID=2066019 RepID=UPI002FDEF245
MTKPTNYSLLKDLPIKQYSLCLLILFSMVVFSCHKKQFKWKTRKKNTVELIEEKDSVLRLEGVSDDPRYGYTQDRPIKIGVASFYLGRNYPEKYFKSITGPHGEKVIFERIKSCCPFKTVNSSEENYQNVAVLEIYQAYYEGLEKPVTLYVNFFDQGKPLAPKGFLVKPFK